MHDEAEAAARIIADALGNDGALLVITGAGISAESGVPTFRGPEGYWTVGSRNYHPEQLATAEAFGQMPREVWRWYLYRRACCRRAQPNAGHLALVDLERAMVGRFTLVTQNVDGLHVRAGSSRLDTLHIHGNIDEARCARGCGHPRFPVPSAFDGFGKDDPLSDEAYATLRCPGCDGPARPHVLWFDEYYDEPQFRAETAMRCAREAAALVVVGTAGATNLPMQIGRTVARLGRPVVDINPEDNPFAALARQSGGHAIAAPAAATLVALRDALVPP